MLSLPTSKTDTTAPSAPTDTPTAIDTTGNNSTTEMEAILANSGLPSFWRHSPKQWFTHVDVVFRIGQVQSDVSRVNFVLAALDEDGIRSVADLLGEDVAYDTLRARLIYTYTMSLAKRIQSIIDPGDRTPSQLLRDMRHRCGQMPGRHGRRFAGVFLAAEAAQIGAPGHSRPLRLT